MYTGVMWEVLSSPLVHKSFFLSEIAYDDRNDNAFYFMYKL